MIKQICSATLLMSALVAGAAELQQGLVGEYFTVKDANSFPTIPEDQKPFYVRVDNTITFNEVTEGEFYGTKLKENFYVRWTGIIKIPKDGNYLFHTTSDDGSRVSINGTVVVDNGGVHPMQEKSGTIELTAGEHNILIEYVQGGGGAGCIARWQIPGQERPSLIPKSALFYKAGSEKIAYDKKAWEKIPSETTAEMTAEYGPYITHTIEAKYPNANNYAYKGVVLKLKEDGSTNVCFDTETLRVSCAWNGGYLRMPRKRDGLEGHPEVGGTPLFGTSPGPGWAKGNSFTNPRENNQGPLPADWAKWKGLYLDGRTVVLSYSVSDANILETAQLDNEIITRILNVGPSAKTLLMNVIDAPDATITVTGDVGMLVENDKTVLVKLSGTGGKLVAQGSRLVLEINGSKETQALALAFASGGNDVNALKSQLEKNTIAPRDLSTHTHGGAPRWGKPLTTSLDEGKGDGAYVVDTINVPFDNEWKSYMRTSGFDFFTDGRAAVCTMDGDVWIVSNFAQGGTPTWQRFATGMFQPLGLKIVDNKIYVLGREQITLLHDLNNDGEADFYQNFNNDCVVTNNYHEFALDLQTDKAGNFYYAKGSPWPPNVTSPHQGCMIKVSKDGSLLEVLATGLRAPNGLGMGPNDELTFSDNQGHWMPACKVSLVKPGKFYGMMQAAHIKPEPTTFEQPLFWLPMNMDNSSGGEGWVSGDKWGPFDGQMVHTSYGKGTFFICYNETVKGQAQGGAVKLPLNFKTGIMRIRQHPIDGQIYVVGMRGWQTAGAQPGAIHRIRYTGKPANLPKQVQTQKDAMVITFTDALDSDSASVDNFSIEAWNYNWTGNYGSPEVKPSDKSKGHDTITPASVTLSSDKKTITLTMPGLAPVNQLKIKYKLLSAAGDVMSNEMYYTINAVP